jgi:hypothetical protein
MWWPGSKRKTIEEVIKPPEAIFSKDAGTGVATFPIIKED